MISLALANARYWPTVAPRVRVELARWEAAAHAIGDQGLRGVAMDKLAEEGMNVKTAATLATLAPRARRGRVVEAIVALQVLYDYLDALDERAVAEGRPDEEEHLCDILVDAVRLDGAVRRVEDVFQPEDVVQPGEVVQPGGAATAALTKDQAGDGGYGARLASVVRTGLAGLPRAREVGQVAREAAARCGRAQVLVHRASALGPGPLGAWARQLEPGGSLGWQELLAGASASVLSLHALIAAAADERTTTERALAIDRAYLAIGALTMLDSVIDHEQDLAAGQRSFVHHYDGDRELLARRGAAVAREARARARALPDGGHHAMTLAGIVAYYACMPGADPEIVAPIRRELEPEITPTIALMRVWRAGGAKRRGRERMAPAAKAPAKTARTAYGRDRTASVAEALGQQTSDRRKA
jgi:tetraprenyl-beta-curcumene synthase